MDTATESLRKLEAKPPARKRRSFHRRYRKLMLAARILLGAALLLSLFAIAHFVYNAVVAADCTDVTNDESGIIHRTEVQSPECTGALIDTEGYMRLDAGIALLGAMLVLGSVGCEHRARRYKPRAPIRPPRPTERTQKRRWLPGLRKAQTQSSKAENGS